MAKSMWKKIRHHLSLGNCYLKTTMRYHYEPIRMAKIFFKTLTKPSGGKIVEQQKLSHPASETADGMATWGTSVAAPYTVKHTSTV